MSGAEALVVVGLAANVLQFLEFTAELCGRIRDYSTGPGLPPKLAAQADRLSDLLVLLRSLSANSINGTLEKSVVARCQAQAEDLALLLNSLKGSHEGQDRWWSNAKKALRSLSRSEKVQELQNFLDNLLSTLSVVLQAETRKSSSHVEANTDSILHRQNAQTAILNDIRLSQLKIHPGEHEALIDQPVWLVNIGRNPDFVGRKFIIDEIRERLEPTSDFVRKAVLCGLGGVGKSQIALEYAYQQRSNSSSSSVFWIHATNTAHFVESFKRIANQCKIPGRDVPGIDVLQLVQDYLETEYERRWLMIIDNVDDRTMFFEDGNYKGKALCEYMPQTALGAILYTTRNRDIGIDLDSTRDPIDVPSMSVEDARSLLGTRIQSQSTEAEQLALLDELVYLPLAITQAVAFMLKRRKHISQYLESYRQSHATRIQLLGQRSKYHGREARPLESVLTTWYISFNSIQSENPRAAELLSIMSYLDRQGIPDSLLMMDSEDSFAFDEAVGLLDAFSLITRSSSGNASNIHRLVQVATRAWLSEYEKKHDASAQEAQRLLAERFPEGWFENWSTCAIYLPHADAVLNYGFINQSTTQAASRATLLLHTSSYLRKQGRLEVAENRSQESLQLHRQLYGDDNAKTLASTAELAMTIHRRGRYEEAVRLQRKVLAGREKVLGYSHRLTLETLNALGYDLRSLGRHKEAEGIHRRELTEKQKLFDENPDDVHIQADLLIAINNAARLLSHQGKYAEAEQMHRDALAKIEKLMGFANPDTFITLGELAGVLRDQDKLEEAANTYEILLENRIKVLGELHPDTLVTRSNIATLRGRQGHQEEAERLYRWVHSDEVKLLGEKHPSTLNTLHNLGCVLADRGRPKEAEEAFRKVIEGQNVALGVNHPDTLTSRSNLSILIGQQGRYTEAESLDRETIELAQSRGAEGDSEHLQLLHKYATLLIDQGKYAEAEPIRRQQLAVQIRITGEDSSGAYAIRQQLAFAIGHQGRPEDAIDLYEQVLKYRVERLGYEHEDTLEALWNLAVTMMHSKRLEEAEPMFTQLVDLKSNQLGPDHVTTLECHVQLSWVQQQLKKYQESEENYRKVLEAQTNLEGPEHPFSLLVTNNLASVLAYQGKNEEAEVLFRRAYEGRVKVLGHEDDMTMKSLRHLTEFLSEIGKVDESSELLERLNALEIASGDGTSPTEDEA